MGIFGAKLEIGPDTLVQRKKNVLFNKINNEIILLSIENSKYYGLGLTGTRIWELLESQISIEELIRKLLCEYQVTELKCTEDTLSFIYRLWEFKLLSLK